MIQRREFSLNALVVLGLALTLAVLVTGGVLGHMSARRLVENERKVSRTQEVIEELGSLLSTVKDAETGQRGYLLTDHEKYLEPFQVALAGVEASVSRLRELTSDNPAQAARLSVLERRIAAKFAELKTTIDLSKKGDRSAAIEIVRSDHGKALMDDVRRNVAVMQEVEHGLLRQRAAEAEASSRITRLSILLPAVIGVILVGLVTFFSWRHVTQRQRAADVLAEQRERLRVTLQSIGDAVITTDTEGGITFMNGVAETLTGWTHTESAGRPLGAVFRIVNERTREDVENPAIRALREGVVVGLANHTVLIRKDGTERPIDDSASPIRDGQGSIVGSVLVFRDIADRRRVEKQMYELLIELKEGDRRKDEFLAILAHELRGPLAPIRNMLEVLNRAENTGVVFEKARSTMERQLAQLVRLVDDLLDVSRITRDRLELRKERVELASVLYQSVETCRPLAEGANHQVTVNLAPGQIYLHADPVRLAQVFGNLLNNACKYTEAGGRISITAERQGSDVVVTVKDTGIGIPPDKLDSVFQMFTQIDRRLERSQGGLGIGLTLVKRLVELHGGSVEASSQGLGRGSEFVVRLPILLDVPPPLSTAPPAEPSLTARRILVVDDNADAALSLAILLKMAGNVTQTAHDGLSALEAAEEFRPDVILLDIGLPKLNGFDTCRRIRERPWGHDVVVVALTGWGQDDDRRKSKDAGFDHHMVKPVDYAVLMKLLAENLPKPP